MKKFLIFILMIITMYFIIKNRHEAFEIATHETTVEINGENDTFWAVEPHISDDYFTLMTDGMPLIAILLGIAGVILFRRNYSPVAAMFISGAVILGCFFVFAKSNMIKKPLYRCVYRTIEAEMDLDYKIKTIDDYTTYLYENRLSKNKSIELANKADFYNVTRDKLTKYEKIDNGIFNKAVRNVYKDIKCADMDKFDVRTMSWREKHNEMNKEREKIKNEMKAKNKKAKTINALSFEGLAKKVKTEYETLMKQHNKEVKEEAKTQKLREKEEKLNNLRNAAKNKAKRALDKVSEFLSTEEEEAE